MSDDDARIASILGEWQARLDRGEDLDPERVIAQHPDLAAELREQLEALAQMRRAHDAKEAPTGQADRMDARSDIYSLGAILYQILTGRLPYEFRTFGELIQKLLHEDVRPAADLADGVPESLSDLCARCLARDPGIRPESADEIAKWIRDWQVQSAADREIERLTREAQSSLATAVNLHGNLRLRQVDAAAATCSAILKMRPDHEGVLELQKEVRALRRRGIEEKEQVARKRVLARVALGALVFAFTQEMKILLNDSSERRMLRWTVRDAATEFIHEGQWGPRRRPLPRLRLGRGPTAPYTRATTTLTQGAILPRLRGLPRGHGRVVHL